MSQMQAYFNQLNQYLGVDLPTLLKALLILIVGWVVARIIAAALREGLSRTHLDNRIADWIWPRGEGKSVPVEQWISRGAFYILLLFVFVGFFQALGLSAVARPLSTFLNQVFAYAPRLIAPLALVLVAWAVASILKTIVQGLLSRINLDARISSQTRKGESPVPLSQTLGEAVYWLVLLLFLPAILTPLGLTGLLEPVQHLVDELLAFLPNLLGALLILGVGWFVARVVQRIVTGLLGAVGLDGFGESVGLSRALGKQRLSDLLGTVVYVLILIPVLIAALDALSIDAITRPASEMLNTILQAIPNVFAAFLVVVIAYVVGGVLAGLVANLLEAVGFDFFLDRIGLSSSSARSGKSPSQIVGRLVLIVLMLFAVAEAAEFMSLGVVREMVSDFLAFGGRVVMGLIILGLGMYLAGVARSAVLTSEASQARLLSTAAYLAILVLSGAMALRQMGLANEIIQLAFGLTVGAVAVALALAFGLGARDAAARQVEEWRSQLESSARRDS